MADMSSLTRRYRRRALLCGGSLTGLLLLGYSLGLFSWLNHLAYDLHFSLRGPRTPSGQVVLVYLDEVSANKLQRRQASWSRRDLAQAIEHLTAAGSEIIGLDMIFSAPAHNPDDDLVLADTIARSNNVVLARISAVPGLGALEPLPLFQRGMIGDGFIDLPLDRDDVLRKIRFLSASRLADGQLELLPAFALEIVRTFRNLDYRFDFSHRDYFSLGHPEQQPLQLPYPELLINYYGTDQVFDRLSYVDVVSNRFDPQRVAGKIVLIGSSLKTEKDVFNTPVSRFRAQDHRFADKFATSITEVQHAKETGLACHAHAIETILSGKYLRPFSPGSTTALLLALAVLSQWQFYRPRDKRATWLALIGLSGAAISGSQLLFNHGFWLHSPPLLAVIWGHYLAGFTLQKNYERHRSEWITNIFGKYVSQSIVDRLVDGAIAPDMGGQRQELTIFFADLRAFTSLAEQLDAHQTTQLLNTYFAAMIPQIQRHQGTVDKLIGDAILAFFGAPVHYPDHPRQAALAALSLRDTLRELKQQHDLPGLSELQLGIGLNTGEVTIGNLGCEAFMDYTVIGDGVNLASRLEGLNKEYGTDILLTQDTACRLDKQFVVRELDQVIVKGKASATTLYELVGRREDVTDDKRRQLQLFADGLGHYRRRQWAQAEATFKQLCELAEHDGPACCFLNRLERIQHDGTAENWDGITRFNRK